VLDVRAVGALGSASVEVVDLWERAGAVAVSELPGMGLLAGDRPGADVELLAGAVAAVEYELARRMHAATRAGGLPLVGPGAVLGARRWAMPHARRLARAGALAAEHPSLAAAWAAGVITSDHVDAIARNVGPLEPEELAAAIGELAGLWGELSPAAVAGFVTRVARVLHPPPDPDPDEAGAYDSRSLSFALTGDSVILAGTLPRLEGEAVIAAVEAFAERLRTQADHVPASARRADGLVALVNAAHAAGSIPNRGGLPVSVSVTLDTTVLGDAVWTTSRGHTMTEAEARFTACDALVTPVVLDAGGSPDSLADLLTVGNVGAPSAAARVAALAATLLGTRIPLAVGRNARTATPAQRRALAARDRGCIIPGCGIPAEACQTHHVQDWAAGGASDLPNLALLCWAHHRQVDLGMWTIAPAAAREQVPGPQPGSPPGTPWPANNGAPWTITCTPRTRWRL
jgi:hypothetical protein